MILRNELSKGWSLLLKPIEDERQTCVTVACFLKCKDSIGKLILARKRNTAHVINWRVRSADCWWATVSTVRVEFLMLQNSRLFTWRCKLQRKSSFCKNLQRYALITAVTPSFQKDTSTYIPVNRTGWHIHMLVPTCTYISTSAFILVRRTAV